MILKNNNNISKNVYIVDPTDKSTMSMTIEEFLSYRMMQFVYSNLSDWGDNDDGGVDWYREYGCIFDGVPYPRYYIIEDISEYEKDIINGLNPDTYTRQYYLNDKTYFSVFFHKGISLSTAKVNFPNFDGGTFRLLLIK